MGNTSYANQRAQLALLAATISCGVAHADELNVGTLPVGAISTSVQSGVSAEICRDHLFDAASNIPKLPTGYRFRLAEEIASSDPAVAELIRLNPMMKSHAVGTLCLMSLATFIVDDKPVLTSGTMPAAFWWVAAEGPPHAAMRGKVRWVQIGSWYSKETGHLEQIRRTDPMARFTTIRVERVSPDDWHLSLVLPSETVEADIRTTSPSTPRKSSGPGYMSVPMSGDSAEYFSVFTYAGHRIRNEEGNCVPLVPASSPPHLRFPMRRPRLKPCSNRAGRPDPGSIGFRRTRSHGHIRLSPNKSLERTRAR